MPYCNILSPKVRLKEDVSKHQAISLTGYLATTGSGDKEPDGIAQYDGKAGEEIAIMCLGLTNAQQDGTLTIGAKVKANAGAIVEATTLAESFATVTAIFSTTSVELMLK